MGRPTLPGELEALLKEYRRLLEAEFGRRLKSLRLFGSQARGDAYVDSDADVSVVIVELTESERVRVIELAFIAWQNKGGHGPLISPLPWTEAEQERRRASERRIALDIDRDGVPL